MVIKPATLKEVIAKQLVNAIKLYEH